MGDDAFLVNVGARVKFRGPNGLLTGTVESIDSRSFPGIVRVRDEQGNLHEIQIELGWP